ncbi:tRNA (guanine-N1)-methyltransferase [Tenacibaculum larymnensis]|uniref:tRNA (Guanine-N1)-methyltransferase n=1 Tax=Tenacibaculum larymnensis TaxID=2878201 RepID=A0A9X4EU96_9FLAO|nr:tRNA (guanine-N1)-methyltransferase [Tenacibaculum larymnensis]MDE1206521.1 tRNA (guanine-N1)-methyltransferase [Tenacibaculum larymnensis]
MKFFKIVFIFIFTQSIIAQDSAPDQPNTVENQFKELYKKSNNYQIYKVVKKNEYLRLQNSILDSIKVIKTDAAAKQVKIDEQQKNITELQTKIDTLNKDLATSIDKEDAIAFIGIPLNKSTYNSIVWGIIFVLLAGLAFFIYRFKNSNVVTKETKSLLTDTEEEFEQYKRKSIEKEQKLRRQLQDEINKQRGVN